MVVVIYLLFDYCLLCFGYLVCGCLVVVFVGRAFHFLRCGGGVCVCWFAFVCLACVVFDVVDVLADMNTCGFADEATTLEELGC